VVPPHLGSLVVKIIDDNNLSTQASLTHSLANYQVSRIVQ